MSRILMRHPDQPGVVVERGARSFPAHAKRGWVEAKSSKAKAVVETPTSPDGEPLTPSQEEDK